MSLTLRENINITRLYEVNSTNLYAKSNLAELADKSVICTDCQTAGRGRFGRAWVDLGSDNIFMSIVLKPLKCDYFANLTQYFSVVLCEILEEYGLKPQIKWPNDVLINGKKIAGILAESVAQGGNFKGLILGAGINLNARVNDLALIKDKEATALNIELGGNHHPSSGTLCRNLPHGGEGCNVDKNEFLDLLLNKFFENYDEFLQKGFVMIKEDYVKRTSFLGKELSVQVFNEKKSGTAKFINNSGELVLEKDGNEFILTMGDILWNN